MYIVRILLEVLYFLEIRTKYSFRTLKVFIMGDLREFATLHDNQYVSFKVTSNSVNFEVKTMGNAGFALSKSLKTPPDFYVTFRTNQYFLFQKIGHHTVRKSARASNIASMDEFRRYWISWSVNSVKFGAEGSFKPILTSADKTTDIKYITFFKIKRIDSPVHWKVELPPIIKAPSLKAINGGELNWVSINADTNILPDGCLIGGYENEMLYIIRAKHRGSVTPGKFVPSQGTAYISWGTNAHAKELFEVLCGYDCAWVPSSEDMIPLGAVVAGHSEDSGHEKLYVGRAKHSGHIIPGKVQPSHKVCYIPYDDKEIAVKDYEILVIPQENNMYENTLALRERINTDTDIDEEETDRIDWMESSENDHYFNAFDLF